MCSFEIVYCDVPQANTLYTLAYLLVERVLLNFVMFRVAFRYYKLSLNQVWIISIINTLSILCILILFINHICHATSFHLVYQISLSIILIQFSILYLYFKLFNIDNVRMYLLCIIECHVLIHIVCLIMLVDIVLFV